MTKIIFTTFSILFSSIVFAQTHYGAISAAAGNAGVAAVELTDGIRLNPATLPFYPMKQIVLSYEKDQQTALIADNGREALFPAGVYYSQGEDDTFKNKSFHLVLGYQLFKNLSLGADVYRSELKTKSNGQNFKQMKADFGVFMRVNSFFNAGLALKGTPLEDTDLPDTVDKAVFLTGGVALSYKNFFQLKADVEKQTEQAVDSDRLAFRLGIETYLNEWIIARVGYINDNIREYNTFTAGLGFAGPQFGLHYAYQEKASDGDSLHVVDLNIPF